MKLRLHRMKKVLARPFENLTALDQLVQIIRLASSLLVSILIFILTVGALVSPTALFMGKLNTSSIDIAYGLFDALQSSVESSVSNMINNGVGLTTSEILILTEYASSRVSEVPDFIVTSVYGWCRVTNSTETHNQTRTACIREHSNYIFDYRDILEDIGLSIILTYAYGTTDSSTAADVNTSSYEDYLKQTRKTKERMINLLYVTLSTQMLLAGLSLWYYSIKDKSLNKLKEQFLVHSISFGSLFIFISSLVVVINLATINIQIRSKIKDELKSFGISYHLGNAWFTALWLLVIFSFVSCGLWSGLEWCISETPTVGENYELGVLANTDDNSLERIPSVGGPLLPRSTSQLLKPAQTSIHSDHEMGQMESADISPTTTLRPTLSSRSGNTSSSNPRVVIPLSTFQM
ncbi:LAMI_0H01222g1_1 [Lachancea mirantina]|uniref:LAMI_0H01222g1_1 n=1 Tax=Lachancea mirantina TaxID=1230905 RepID=A0A1G4KDR7_9SACH|nr:LAMI_0H01222g1_1 [Lachancea mirantina]